MNEHSGACHCGAIRIRFSTAKSPSELGARACQCSFCRMQGALWTADPDGFLDILAATPPTRYRFGTETADFLLCPRCGVVPAVVAGIERELRGVVRVQCLADADAFLGAAAPADYDDEDLDTRLARRAGRWTPARLLEPAQ